MPANHRRTGDFGRRLRAWRRQRGLSQLELALRVGTTPRHISFLETGRSRPGNEMVIPGNEMVIRLARELDVPPREQNALLEAAGLPATYSHHPLEASEITRFSAVIELAPQGARALASGRHRSIRHGAAGQRGVRAPEVLALSVSSLRNSWTVSLVLGHGVTRSWTGPKRRRRGWLANGARFTERPTRAWRLSSPKRSV